MLHDLGVENEQLDPLVPAQPLLAYDGVAIDMDADSDSGTDSDDDTMNAADSADHVCGIPMVDDDVVIGQAAQVRTHC